MMNSNEPTLVPPGSRDTARLFALLRLVLFAALTAFFVTVAHAADYKLGPQDRLRVRVVEWQTIEGTFREWDAIGGEYTIDGAGNLSVPFVGEFAAAGRTTVEIATTVEETLQQKFGLTEKPEAAVEIVQYRPIFVTGDVQSSGQYPFAPSMTVLKAVSIAGGQVRAPAGARAERDFINARGSFEVLADKRARLLVRRARLNAEAKGDETFDAPSQVASSPNIDAIMADETAIMNARQRKLTLQLQALARLKELLASEIDSLDRKSVTQTRQIELAKSELQGIGSLAEKGIVANTRVLSAERMIADMESRQLDLETAKLRARQDISKAEQDEINLRNSMESDLAVERQSTEADLNETLHRLEMYDGLISEASLMMASFGAAAGQEPTVIYIIVRTVDGATRDILASENTELLPADILKVKMQLPAAPMLSGQ